MTRKIIAAVAVGAAALGGLTACSSDADVASSNISKAADNFEIERQIVFLNVRSGKYELEVIGLCNINDDGSQLEVTCKIGPDQFVKHFLGKAGDLSYFVFQRKSVNVSVDHYRVNVKPESIIPDFDKR